MSSSFQRRAPARSITLPAGVRASQTSNSVPLLSTGLPALDDIISGRGQPASSSLTLIPAVGTASTDVYVSEPSWRTDGLARAAAEPYTDIVLAYSLAQGLVAGHTSLLIGQDTDSFAHSAFAQAGEESTSTSNNGSKDQQGDIDYDDDDTSAASADLKGKSKEMEIAWRYEKMKRFQTTVDSVASANRTQAQDEQTKFCATFDLSSRTSAARIELAKADHKLQFCEVDPLHSSESLSSFEKAWMSIVCEVERCKSLAAQSSPTSPPPALRILVRSLGSSAWTVKRGQTRQRETIRFLLRLRHLLRSLCSPWLGRRTTDISETGLVAIATLTISASLLSCTSSCNIAHRIAHLSDSCILLSSFAASPSLRAAFPTYTGGLGIACTPSIGTLSNLSIRASVLRGMGAGGGGVGGKTMEGGAGGAENNLAFKLKRKKFVVETLHLDIDGGVSERRTKPIKKTSDAAGPTAPPNDPASRPIAPSSSPQVPLPPAPSAAQSSALVAPSPQPRPSAFVKGGLSALRARGLDAQKNSITKTPGAPPQQIKIDGSDEVSADIHKHLHTHGERRTTRDPVFKSNRAEDYEF